jgi:protein disulfide-isomerase
MKNLLTRVLTVAALFAMGATAAFAAEGWSEDYAKSVAKAKAEKKMVLIDFTGSDWCPPCKKMAKEVFGQQEFSDYAKDKLVLVELDFPNAKSQPAEVKQQNQKLQAEYKIEGYPTVIVLNPDGKEVARWVGFQPGGPKALIAKIDALKGK